MKKSFQRKLQYLLCFFLIISCFVGKADVVSAVRVTQEFVETNKSKMGKIEFVSYQKSVTYHGKTYYFANFSVGGTLALCADPFTYLTAAAKQGAYITEGRNYNSTDYGKALTYLTMKKNPSKDEYVIAQAYAWMGSSNLQAIRNIALRYDGIIDEEGNVVFGGGVSQQVSFINKVISDINKISPIATNLYLWESACGKSQRFVTLTLAKTPCDETCVCEGGDEETEEETCPAPEQTGSGECTNTSFDDPNWDCIVGYSDYLDTTHNAANNPYCSFYCKETLESSFPFTSRTYEAGQYFTVGSGLRNVWGPVEFHGTRECRSYYKSGSTWVEGIDTSTFVSNYNSAVQNMAYDYTNWQNAARKNSAVAAIPEQQASASYHPECSHQELDYHKEIPCYQQVWTDSGWYGYWDDCGYDVYKTVYDKYYPSTSYKKCNVYGSCWTETIYGGCSRPAGDGNESTYRNNYNNAITRANTYVNYMRQCELMNTPYKLNPVVNFDYHVDPTYSWSGQLKSSYQDDSGASPISGSTSGNKNGTVQGTYSGCSGSSCNMKRYNCSGEYCYIVPNVSDDIYNVNVTSKRTVTFKTATYSLPDNLYQFVDKISGQSYNALPSNIKDTNAYINLSESTMPIDKYITPGRYKLYLSYSKLGNIVNGSAHFDRLVSNIETDYMCPFIIKNSITGKECELDPTLPDCQNNNPEKGDDDMSGIDVIYRTIKLGDEQTAFPSIDGDGRTPGSNWNSEDGSLVSNYITYNRGVEGEQVYTLTPLYKITLTPAIIKQIRSYNQAINDYGDFNLTCEVDNTGRATGRKCISNFIHNTVKAKGKTYNFSSYFDSKATCQNITTGTFNSCADK